MLTAVQLGKLLVTSRILIDNKRASAEADVMEIMKTLQTRNISELHIFLQEVNSLVAQVREFLQFQALYFLQGLYCFYKTIEWCESKEAELLSPSD